MEIEETEKNLSDILKDVHDNTEKFDPQRHFKLMDACKLCKYEDPQFVYISQVLIENQIYFITNIANITLYYFILPHL